MESQRVRHPVFLPGESQGRGSLVGCRLWGRTESDTRNSPPAIQCRKGSHTPWLHCPQTLWGSHVLQALALCFHRPCWQMMIRSTLPRRCSRPEPGRWAQEPPCSRDQKGCSPSWRVAAECLQKSGCRCGRVQGRTPRMDRSPPQTPCRAPPDPGWGQALLMDRPPRLVALQTQLSYRNDFVDNLIFFLLLG